MDAGGGPPLGLGAAAPKPEPDVGRNSAPLGGAGGGAAAPKLKPIGLEVDEDPNKAVLPAGSDGGAAPGKPKPLAAAVDAPNIAPLAGGDGGAAVASGGDNSGGGKNFGGFKTDFGVDFAVDPGLKASGREGLIRASSS